MRRETARTIFGAFLIFLFSFVCLVFFSLMTCQTAYHPANLEFADDTNITCVAADVKI